jgi:ubiquinone/menaquinone biosynthesis C-methylase UbiE
MFEGLSGRILDAGIGTGRNIAFYPAGSRVVGIDLSPAMLARARLRLRSAVPVELAVMDVTRLGFPNGAFDAAVATFLFCVLPDALQLAALAELRRVVKPGGTVRLLEYVRPSGRLRRAITRLWAPWVRWAYGAGFERNTALLVPQAGLDLVDSRFVVADLVIMLSARVPQ